MKRTTLILILLALGLGSFVYFHEIRGATQQEEVKEKQQQIFSFAENDVQSLTVKTKNNILEIERNPKPETPKWLIKSPVSEPANDAIVAYLMDLLVKGKSERTLSTPPNQLSEFGLDQPQATIDIKLKNQQSYQLTLGKTDFNNAFLYAQVKPNDKINENVNILLVSKDFANAVNRELSEWQESKQQPLPSLPNLPEPTPTNTK